MILIEHLFVSYSKILFLQ